MGICATSQIDDLKVHARAGRNDVVLQRASTARANGFRWAYTRRLEAAKPYTAGPAPFGAQRNARERGLAKSGSAPPLDLWAAFSTVVSCWCCRYTDLCRAGAVATQICVVLVQSLHRFVSRWCSRYTDLCRAGAVATQFCVALVQSLHRFVSRWCSFGCLTGQLRSLLPNHPPFCSSYGSSPSFRFARLSPLIW